jgi:LuxR family transcriptional regulator, maltose regulon positive regulatory protein
MQRLDPPIRSQPKRSDRRHKPVRKANRPALPPVRRATQSSRSDAKPNGALAVLHPASHPHRHPPAPAPHSVPRHDLLQRILQAREASVIALVAPAGYGKSALLSEWAACDARTFAYLELTRHEDDPALLSSLLAQTIAPIAATSEQAVLVLDRVDRLHSLEALAVVDELAHELPPALTLALASRGEPPLRLGGLRAAERLLQLGVRELAMTSEEAERLLAAAGVRLEPRSLERLLARTEGWPAGLHLAALALRERAASGVDGSLTGEEHTIAQYISEEILAPLEPDARAVLMRSSILDELSGETCDATLARKRSGRLLADLAAAGTMLRAIDAAHTRFRCHPLVRDVLRRELALEEPTEIALLHTRASGWFARQGDNEQALEHAFAARDPRLAGELVWAEAAHLLYGRDEHLGRWLSTLTEQQVASSARLALAAAHSELALGDVPAARHWARLADERLKSLRLEEPERSSLGAAAKLAQVIAGSCSVEQMARDAEPIRAKLGENDPMRSIATMLGGVAAHLLDERKSARALLEQALERCTHEAMPMVASISLAQLALIDVEEGQLDQAEEEATDAEALTRGLAPRRLSALAHATLAFVKSRRGLADEAKRELAYASRLLELPGELMPFLEVETRVVMARASIRLADAAHARALLSRASRLARRPQPVVQLLGWIDQAWGEIDELGIASMNRPGSLTMAELRVLRFLPTHLSFREIGERLHVSGNTVKSQAHAIYAKLDAASRTEAVARASALGLIDAAVV